MKALITAGLVGATMVYATVAGIPAANAGTGFCDQAAKHSEQISCHQACDELNDQELCHSWQAIILSEHGD